MARITKGFWEAYKKLHSDTQDCVDEQTTTGNVKVAGRKKSQPKRNLTPSEANEQVRFVVWLQKNKILHYAIANGGFRRYEEAIHLKQQGVSPGVPDICVPVPSGGFWGLYLELKRSVGGKVSDAQTWWLDKLNAQGYHAVVARGCDCRKARSS